MPSLDEIAESYVRLTLALGEIDPYHVDAYFGPEEWRNEARSSSLGLDGIVSKGRDARCSLPDRPTDSRAKFLAKQLDALIARAEIRNGVPYSFDQESAAVYDVVAPTRPDSYYARIVQTLEPLLPGNGVLAERWEAYRSQFYVPADRVEALFQAATEEARARTKNFIDLPPDEKFEIELVSGQVWGAYNWYKGRARSLIQVNTDLPMTINRLVHLACHEGYPGHHVYNALLEKHMVRERDWVEFTIYPLYSPESLIAEGTAEYGVELSFTAADRLAFEQEVLYPLAGLDSSRAEELLTIQTLVDGLGNASNEAARDFLDGRATRDQTKEWLQDFALSSPERAEKSLRFFEAHRSYIVTYNVGEGMVRNFVERKATSASEKWRVFTSLLSQPTVPSDLVATALS